MNIVQCTIFNPLELCLTVKTKVNCRKHADLSYNITYNDAHKKAKIWKAHKHQFRVKHIILQSRVEQSRVEQSRVE